MKELLSIRLTTPSCDKLILKLGINKICSFLFAKRDLHSFAWNKSDVSCMSEYTISISAVKVLDALV